MTLKLLRERGYLAQVVEKWQPHSKRRIDLFGIIDIVAAGPGKMLGVQSTSWAARREHLLKLQEKHKELQSWNDAGGTFVMICWKKRKKVRGGVAFTYTPEWEEYHYSTLDIKPVCQSSSTP